MTAAISCIVNMAGRVIQGDLDTQPAHYAQRLGNEMYYRWKMANLQHWFTPLRRRLLRFAYSQLYTTYAFAYDTVAAAVSFGEWQAWGSLAMQFIGGPTSPVSEAREVLELAHGPGHLQLALRQAGYSAYGVDLSPQMSSLARQRLARAGVPVALAHASVYALPFADHSFHACISAFPAEFIDSPQVFRETRRVLVDGGSFIVVSAASLNKRTIAVRAIQLAYLAAGETALPVLTRPAVADLFIKTGFEFSEYRVSTQHATVNIWVGSRKG